MILFGGGLWVLPGNQRELLLSQILRQCQRHRGLKRLASGWMEGETERGARAAAADRERQRSHTAAKEDTAARRSKVDQVAWKVIAEKMSVRAACREVGLEEGAKSSVSRMVKGMGDGCPVLTPDAISEPVLSRSAADLGPAEKGAAAAEKRRETLARKDDEASQYKPRGGKGVGGSFARYREAVVKTQEWRRVANASIPAAQRYAKEQFGIEMGRWVIQQGVSPNPVGAPTALPREEEDKLVDMIVMLRTMLVDLDRECILAYVNQMIEGTELEKKLPNGVGKDWYKRFMNDHADRLGRKSSDSLEFDRVRWARSEIMETHYARFEEMVLALNLGVKNPEYDPSVPYNPKDPDPRCERIIITKRENIVSLDETEVTGTKRKIRSFRKDLIF